MTPYTPQERAIRERLAKITPGGPWQWDEPSNWHGLSARVFIPDPYGVVAEVPIEAWRPRSIGKANADFIAHAPEDVAWLLAELTRTQGQREALRGAVQNARIVLGEAGSDEHLKQLTDTELGRLWVAVTKELDAVLAESDQHAKAQEGQ